LFDRNCAAQRVSVKPRLVCGEFRVLIEAALAGSGVAWLPESACVEELRSGRLQQVLPEWGLPQGILHIVYPSRRGMLPAVRALVEFLVEAFEHPAVAGAD
jgi:DNA-binding transcriptional LysR family regulator